MSDNIGEWRRMWAARDEHGDDTLAWRRSWASTPTPEPSRVLVVGDTHAHNRDTVAAVRAAVEHGCDGVLQLGDFGIGTTQRRRWFLNEVNTALIRAGLWLWFVDGNHDDHAHLARARLEHPAPDGTVPVAPRIRWLPRGHRWTWQQVRFGALGGAYSVDGDLRTAGIDWWPGIEEVQPEDVDRLGSDPLDVLVTHDTPAGAPIRPEGQSGPRIRPIHETNALITRSLIRRAVTVTRPQLVIHGHHHVWLSSELLVDGGHVVQIEGLPAGAGNWRVLNLHPFPLYDQR